MRAVTKTTKTLSLDRDIVDRIQRTKGTRSDSERANQLLRKALDIETNAALEREVEALFARPSKDRKERRAFQKATVAVLTRRG
jgi:hypothetical protein